MDAHKEKFRKAFDDQEKSTAAYNKANDDGNVTRNEVKLNSCGGFFSGERFKKHDIDHKIGGQYCVF